MAILGGKYFFYADLKDNLSSLLTDELAAEVQAIYFEEKAIAEVYDQARYDDEALRGFMVDYGFTESMSPENVTMEEFNWFQMEIAPQLQAVLTAPDFESWYQTGFQAQLGQVSTLDLVIEDIGLFSIIFLLLGISTAYRLGRGTDA